MWGSGGIRPRGAARPAVFHSIEPAWHDQNLREITQAVRSPLFFSHVRAAGGPPIQNTNCHPFRYENHLFMHNGFLSGFATVKRDLTFAIDPSLYPHVRGTTDSEVLFHLALTLGLRDDPVTAMRDTVRMVESVGREHGVPFPMQGTMAVSDGETIWGFRYSTQGRSRSLFHSADIPTLRRAVSGCREAQALRRHGARRRVGAAQRPPRRVRGGAGVDGGDSGCRRLPARAVPRRGLRGRIRQG